MVYLDHIWQETIMVTPQLPVPPGDYFALGGVLTPAIRRDLADLNRQFLELGLSPALASDPRFAWSEPVRSGLAQTDAATRDRMAACPFALFELRLPRTPGEGRPSTAGVEDAASGGGLADPWLGRCLAFAHFALFVALRLADAAPLATRIALGLSPADELRLNEMCPSEAARMAASTEAFRPRWPAHPRFWAMLRGAARSNSGADLRWAHCVGICLLGTEIGAQAASDGAARTLPRRPLR
jgi:hypothetical protein